LNDFLAEQLQDAEFAQEYWALGPQYQVAEQVIRLRQARGLTQSELAELAETKQSGISRLETATSAPSLSFLLRVADALGADLKIRLVPKTKKARS
jgi:transcriptional regulator with XRE-family HTH domain